MKFVAHISWPFSGASGDLTAAIEALARASGRTPVGSRATVIGPGNKTYLSRAFEFETLAQLDELRQRASHLTAVGLLDAKRADAPPVAPEPDPRRAGAPHS